MNYYRNIYLDQGYKNYAGPRFKNDSVLKSSAEEFTPGFSVKIEPFSVNTVKETSLMKPTITEFVPGGLGKGVNAGASDFKPLSKANLNSEAALFGIEKAVPRDFTQGFKAGEINEFVTKTLPEEKFDEPILIIQNREFCLEDLSKNLKDVKINVQIKRTAN